jgi:hypothetical protein
MGKLRPVLVLGSLEHAMSKIGNSELSLTFDEDGYGAYLEIATSGSPPVATSNTGRLIYNTATQI